MLSDTQLQNLQNDLREQKALLAAIERILPNLPNGFLEVRRRENHCYYYRVTNSNGARRYTAINLLHEDSPAMLCELASRRWMRHCLPVLRKNISSLEHLLRQYRRIYPLKVSQSELADPSFYLPGYYHPITWSRERYDSNPYHCEQLLHDTERGDMVRSKSEVLIANALYAKAIPYRYEAPLSLPRGTIYPDFQLLHPSTGKLIIWEHFGLMDNGAYALRALQKLQDYAAAGYHLNDRLYITWETSAQPLTIRQILSQIDAILASEH